MTPRSLAGALTVLVLGTGGMAWAQAPPVGAAASWSLTGVLKCTEWKAEDQQIVKTGAAAGPPGAEPIEVSVHLMAATIGTRPKNEPVKLLAPEADAVTKLWTPARLAAVLGPDGLVNGIWKPSIHLRVARIENCSYTPGLLRLDELERDSIFTPITRVPWATQLFRSVNRLFTRREPARLHVLLWWALEESEVGVNSVAGYARAAAKGGPAAWVSTYECLRPDADPSSSVSPLPGCARLIAHEVGHALSLHHTPAEGCQTCKPKDNLMHKDHLRQTLEDWQREQARAEARRRFRNP
jgi:hypothetical protein